MKTGKTKIMHKSFLTNQDLIQGLRNQSNGSTRHHTSRMYTERSKITLIKKKSFQRMHSEQQNSFYHANIGLKEPIGSPLQKAVFLLQDCLTTLGEQSPKMQHKLRKALNYIRQGQEQQKKQQQLCRVQLSELQQSFQKKLQVQRQENSKLRKMNDDLKLKIMQYRQKILDIRRQTGTFVKEKQPSGLQQIIINQSQIIDKQCDEYQQQSNELRWMLKTQALQIEAMLKKQKNNPLRAYTSLQNSFIGRK